MKHSLFVLLLLSAILAMYSGCDQGLAPLPPPPPIDPNAPTGFGGTIYFRNWPHIDSVDNVVWELRLAIFKQIPVDTSGLFNELLRGNVLIYPQIGQTAFSKRDPRDSTGRTLRDTIQYEIYFTTDLDSLPKSYNYAAMAWRFSPNLFVDWKPAGLYATQPYGFTPKTITVRKNIFLRNIDIYCDFRNPPPKPWR